MFIEQKKRSKNLVQGPGARKNCLVIESYIDHVYSDFDCKILNVGEVNYNVFDQMPVVCKVICKKTRTETFNQKYVQDFSTFDVGVFINSLRMELQKLRLYAECCEGVNKC